MTTSGQLNQASSRPAADGAFPFSSQIAQCEDLTHRLRTSDVPNTPSLIESPQFERTFDALARVLHRRSQGHAILVGERGVGVNMLAVDIARRGLSDGAHFLRNFRFIVVNCRHTIPDESRDRLLAVLAQVAPHESLVVFIEGFGSLLRGDRGLTNKSVLLSALSNLRCRLVGVLTPYEYSDLVADDPELLEYFAPISVEELDIGSSCRLLRQFAFGLEQRYDVEIDDSVISTAVSLSANYILNERLPAKAIRILTRVCDGIRYESCRNGAQRRRLTPSDVVNAVSELSGVPSETLHGIGEAVDYEAALQDEVFGQPHAVRTVATELRLIKSGLTDFGKPASVMLFVGQTGTGKTELAKVLARFYSTSKRLHTYTLGNFVEPHSVAGIIGVPPGYVGHDQGGRLVNELNMDPYGVFLLDEADKAHPDVLQPFLNLFDEGWIVDQRGVKAYANHAIFILTTNVGQRILAEMAKEGKSAEEMSLRIKDTLAQIKHGKANRPVFASEFLARIKRTIVFLPLNASSMVSICRKLLRDGARIWKERRQKDFIVADDLIHYIGSEAHRLNERSEGREGGRIVRKLIADVIDANVQSAIMLRMNEYQRCSSVAVESDRAGAAEDGEHATSPTIAVRFR